MGQSSVNVAREAREEWSEFIRRFMTDEDEAAAAAAFVQDGEFVILPDEDTVEEFNVTAPLCHKEACFRGISWQIDGLG